MARVKYVIDSGEEYVVEVAEGTSVMHGAVKNGVPGVIGDCGGACTCATCHVYVDAEWIARTGPITSMEAAMLECTATEKRATSRLSCQIFVTDALDGLVVVIPPNQH